MVSIAETKKDRIWNGLPAIFYQDKYIIFSPYTKSVVSVTEDQLLDGDLRNDLSDKGFFGKPLERKEDRLSITLYLTSNCNLKCIYCFDDKNDGCYTDVNQKIMDSEFAVNSLEKVISNFDDLKLHVHFFGGEPTLNMKTIKSVVDHLENKNLDVNYRVSTNLITKEENIKHMISKNFGFDICCDGRPEINDRQRPLKSRINFKPSKYLEDGIKLLTSNNARIRTKVVVTDDSIEEMPSAIDYLASLGVDHIRLESVLIDGRAKGFNPVNVEKFVDYFFKAADKAVEIGKETGRTIYVSNWAIKNLFNPRDHFCEFLRGNRIIILPDGEIGKCIRNIHSDENSPFIIGKVNEDLYLNRDRMSYLRGLSVENMEECGQCVGKYSCSGGCYNENLSMEGDFKTPYKVKCDLSKLMIRESIIRMYEIFK